MSHEVNIIRAELEHIEIVAQLFDGYRQFYGQSHDIEGSRRFLAARLEQDQSVIFLALEDGAGCGFTQLYPAFSSVSMRPLWILNDLFVAPQARKLGVGKGLMQAATEFAAETGAKRLVLATEIDNLPAQSLYEKMGWIRDDAFIHYNYEF